MSKFNFKVTRKEYQLVLEARRQVLFLSEIQEMECQQCKNAHPANKIESDVREKVKILNKYFHTRVNEDDVTSHIVKNCNIIDSDITNHLPRAVSLIAFTGNRNEFSFATKYCALLQPDYYPIYDRYVWKFFLHLNKLGFFDKATEKKIANVNKNRSTAYSDYIYVYNEFIDKSGIKSFYKSYREVDKYIWGAIRMYLLIEKDIKYSNISPTKQWLQTFVARLLANLTTTAIWAIISHINF